MCIETLILIANIDIHVNKQFITRMLHRMGWSFKVPTSVNIKKWTVENIQYYEKYYSLARNIPLSKLKFMDESSFNNQG